MSERQTDRPAAKIGHKVTTLNRSKSQAKKKRRRARRAIVESWKGLTGAAWIANIGAYPEQINPGTSSLPWRRA